MGELKIGIFRTYFGREPYSWFDRSDIHDDIFFLLSDVHHCIKKSVE